MQIIRQAKETDRKEIVDCILDAFQKDFSEFIHNVGRDKVHSFLADSLSIHYFYVIENEQGIVGVLALSNIEGRAVCSAKKAAQKYFGFLIGWLLYTVNFRDFEINYCNSDTTGFIEFVAVKQEFQGRGFASLLIKKVISETRYTSYLLDVVDTNHAAVHCYSKLDFVEVKREKVMFSKQKGFKEKIFMEYRRDNSD